MSLPIALYHSAEQVYTDPASGRAWPSQNDLIFSIVRIGDRSILATSDFGCLGTTFADDLRMNGETSSGRMKLQSSPPLHNQGKEGKAW